MQWKNFLRRSLGPVVSIVLFAVAGWLLHNELRVHHFNEIVAAFQSLPNRRLWAALGLTLAGYLVMTGYDLLALRYVGHPLPVRKTAGGDIQLRRQSGRHGPAAAGARVAAPAGSPR
jgi:uncharacterized membrane protein YbhN (UPF0104 family)